MVRAQDLVIIGGGEHARVVIDAAHSRLGLWTVLGIVDPQPCVATTRLMGVSRLGDEAKGPRLAARPDGPAFVIGVGGVGRETPRPAIAKRFALDTSHWASVVHAAATGTYHYDRTVRRNSFPRSTRWHTASSPSSTSSPELRPC